MNCPGTRALRGHSRHKQCGTLTTVVCYRSGNVVLSRRRSSLRNNSTLLMRNHIVFDMKRFMISTDRLIDELINGSIDEWMDEKLMEGRMNGCTYIWATDGWIDKCMYVYMDGWIEGWIDGWIKKDWLTDRQIKLSMRGWDFCSILTQEGKDFKNYRRKLTSHINSRSSRCSQIRLNP